MSRDNELRLEIQERLLILLDKRVNAMATKFDTDIAAVVAAVSALAVSVDTAVARLGELGADHPELAQAAADIATAKGRLDAAVAAVTPPADNPPVVQPDTLPAQ